MTYSVVCLCVAVGLIVTGVLLVRADYRRFAARYNADRAFDATLAKRMHDARCAEFDAQQNARIWQSIQDRLAVDALVGKDTWGVE